MPRKRAHDVPDSIAETTVQTALLYGAEDVQIATSS